MEKPKTVASAEYLQRLHGYAMDKIKKLEWKGSASTIGGLQVDVLFDIAIQLAAIREVLPMFVQQPIVNSSLVQAQAHEQIDHGIQRAQEALYTSVSRIRYSIQADWSGRQAIFFRILLHNPPRISASMVEIRQAVQTTTLKEIDPESIGLRAYWNFRTETQWQQAGDTEW